jgi:hypothetical protein
MEKALSSILLGDIAINAAISGRVSPLKRDDFFPAITYEKTGKTQERDASGRGSGIIQSDFTITSRATGYQEAYIIAQLISEKLEGLKGLFIATEILLTVQNDEGVNQLLDPDITEITLNYTFYHR